MKYVWAQDILVEERGFAFSSREEAIRDLPKAWARNSLNDYCVDTWSGADAHKGVIDVDQIQVEQIGSTRWVGAARVHGYCRIFAHDDAYDDIARCVSESRGQPRCAVRERH